MSSAGRACLRSSISLPCFPLVCIRCRSFVAARVPSPVKRSGGDGPRSPPKLIRRATEMSRHEAYTSGRSSVLTKCLVRLVLGFYRQDIVEVGGACVAGFMCLCTGGCKRCGGARQPPHNMHGFAVLCAVPTPAILPFCSASSASSTNRCGVTSWKLCCVSRGNRRHCPPPPGSADAQV